MSEKQAYPLTWPDGWRRTAPSDRKIAQFGTRRGVPEYRTKRQVTVAEAVDRVRAELFRMGIEAIIISTNVEVRQDGLPYSNRREPRDPGAAVYWRAASGREQCMAIDRYDRVADNLAAIAATIEALRAIERHGGAEILDRAFRGFAALPEATAMHPAWRVVFGFALNAAVTLEEMESKFRELARQHHPDAGGEEDQMRALIQARSQARAELGG